MIMALVAVLLLGKKTATIARITSYNTPNDTSIILRKWVTYLSDNNFAFPEVVASQMVHETDFFASVVFKENHNGFGMKHNGRGYSLGEKNGHAYYRNFKDSLKDYLAYQNKMLFYAAKQNRYPHTNEEYMALLEDLPQFGVKKYVRYATDPNYVARLKKRLEQLKNM